MNIDLRLGSCIDVMATLPENSVDTIITDPPYHLTSITKRFGGKNAAPAQFGTDGAFARASKGFMGKTWDGGDVAFQVATWEQAYRVLKPGGFLLAFGGTRTYHRMVCAIEDAGFEIRDTIAWVYGSGFPKSYDISKGIDKKAGAKREVVGVREDFNKRARKNGVPSSEYIMAGGWKSTTETVGILTAPSTPEAQLWDGWGTALKPAHESVCIAQKPEQLFWERGIIVENLNKLEGRLWSLLPANIVEKNFGLSQKEYGEVCDSARWSADEKQRTLEGLLEQMDMSQLESATISSLNTVSLWKSTLAEVLSFMNTCTTETGSSLPTDLKILNCSLSQLTPQGIITAKITQDGQPSNVSTVGSLFYAVTKKLSYIQELSAQENVTSRENLSDLRPNNEPIVVAMKPIDGNFVNNALTWGVAGLWIDGGRVGTDDKLQSLDGSFSFSGSGGANETEKRIVYRDAGQGRFPANFIHDGSDEVVEGFPNGAQRFFYCAKASRSERNAGLEGLPDKERTDYGGFHSEQGLINNNRKPENRVPMQNGHPTVKPIELMRYLVRLTKTPTGGVVLDPFMGSGTTGMACVKEGRNFIGIELDEEYLEIAKKRIEHAQAECTQLSIDNLDEEQSACC